MNLHAVLLLTAPRRRSAATVYLQITASAVTTLLTFAVVMLAMAFWNVDSDEPGYSVLAVGLVVALIVPLVTLGTAAARLAARSRDDRLAALRLLGATASQVRRLALIEVTVVAAFGVAVGTALSLALPFALGLLSVYGQPLDVGGLWLPWWLSTALPLVLVLVAAISALLGLHQVVLSPLEVRIRQDAPKLSWMRVVIGGAIVVGAALVVQVASPGWGVVVILGAFALVVLAVMAVFGVAGPFVTALIARRVATRTSDAARLLAARGIQDDPKAAWRSVSALALASFIVIPAGSLLGYLDTISHSASREVMTVDQLLMFDDARTMLVALVVVSFVIVACQIAITQTAAIIENRDLYVALDRIGMPRAALNRSRRLRVTTSARIAVLAAACAAIGIAFVLVAAAAVLAPVFIVVIALVLTLGLLLIRAGVTLTAPVLSRVLDAPARGE